MHKNNGEINRSRRRFSSMAALTLAAAQFGVVRPAPAQSKTPGLPANKREEFFPGFSTELIKTSGTTIHAVRKGTGPPLLLLHGYPETHLTWRKVAPQLAEQFSVVVPDLRGYGASGKPEGGKRHENYSFRAMAPAERSSARSMCCGARKELSVSCGTYSPLGERSASRR